MTADDFPHARTLRIEQPPRRPFPWWAPLGIAATIVALILGWRATDVPGATVGAPQPQQIVIKEIPVTATATRTPAWTQTPRIVTATATATVTAPAFCDASTRPGDVCAPAPRPAPTLTPVPTCSSDPMEYQRVCVWPGDPGVVDGEIETR